jgi:cysteine desulfurase
MKVYLDNAATTAIDPEVLEAMIPVLRNTYGNPSSIHNFGRKTKALIEVARKQVAAHFHVSPGEIFFTSGGTEADNMAIRCAIEDMDIRHAITSRIEHHAVLHTLEILEKKGKIKLDFVNLDSRGHVDLKHLEELLQGASKTMNGSPSRSFVSLMHANNEIGNLLPLKKTAELCQKYNAVFHSDTVQTMGHYAFDLSKIPVHFVTCSAHKFHGPKGIGFLYINSNIKISPLIHGGAQERNMRGGTENVYGIIGLAKALEISHREMAHHQQYIQGLKTFNGDAKGSSLYTVLNVLLPKTSKGEMLIYHLDISGIAASAGSACSSGSNTGSHVLRGIGCDMTRPAIRFSFSKYNTKEEIDYCVSKVAQIYSPTLVSQ